MRELFRQDAEPLTRAPERPLGPISDYVIEEMPMALARITSQRNNVLKISL